MTAPLHIVVLGCPARPDGAPSPALERRLRRALLEWRRQRQAVLVVCGGPAHGTAAEADVMAGWLAEHGVPAAAIVAERVSRTTVQNLRFALPLLRERNAERVCLVTERFHMHRAHRILRALLRREQLAIKVERASAEDNLRGLGGVLRRTWEIFATLRDSLQVVF